MSGTSSITGLESITFTDNMSFDGTQRGGAMTTDGQLWIGSTSGRHVRLGSITAGAGITVTNGPGSISVALTGGGIAVEHLTGNTGGALNPDGSNNFNILGTGSITIAGSGSTLTTQLTGLTNHAVLIGAGTATITNIGPTSTSGQILQSAGASADPAFSTATYPSTTTINQLLYSSSANTVVGLATANRGVLTTGATGIPIVTALATDGQLIIGSTSGVPVAATLTAGTGITITNASNSVTISASTSGFTWTDVTGSTQTIASENGYITDNAGGVIYTLPVSASLGDTFIIIGKLGLATITPLALQQLLIGSASGTIGITGTAVSTNVGDSITFVCTTAGASAKWRAQSFVGNWTLS